jgi:hypothetical protein
MISCAQRRLPIPKHIIALRHAAEQYMSTSVFPTWELSGIIFEFTNFRAAVRDGQIFGPRTVIEAASGIDQNFVASFENVPESRIM